MGKYILKRCLNAVLVLFLVATAVFCIMRIVGDPATLMLDANASVEDYAQLRTSLGLDDPLYIQYFNFLKEMCTLDLGTSYRYNRPVIDMISEAMPYTLGLVGLAVLIAIPLAMAVGIIAAVKRGSWIDNILTVVTISGRSMPNFWLCLLLMLVFAVKLGWLPPSGSGSFRYMIMPAITLSMGLATSTVRLTRNSMLSVIRQDYMTTAKAKGVPPVRLLLSHGLRNSLISVITMIALQIGSLLGGSIVVETVFSYPGLGRVLVTAILVYDYPVVQACIVIMAALFVAINLIVDLLYCVIDPRISVQ